MEDSQIDELIISLKKRYPFLKEDELREGYAVLNNMPKEDVYFSYRRASRAIDYLLFLGGEDSGNVFYVYGEYEAARCLAKLVINNKWKD